jgi:8-oxo-dGTP pyrophosphatase MutT (NUDIX family)
MAASSFPSPKIIRIEQSNMTYTDRHAVRVAAFNAKGEVAIIYAKRDNYYKLPGGGIDSYEDHETAVKREFEEETGGLIKLRGNGCMATTKEFRNDLRQISYCYAADLVDDSGKPTLTDEEISDGLDHSWMSVEEAKRVMAGAEPTSELGKCIKERDIYLLEEAT